MNFPPAACYKPCSSYLVPIPYTAFVVRTTIKPSDDCGCCGDGFRHFVHSDLHVFLSGTNDIDLSVFIREVNPAVGSDRRSGKRAARSDAAAVETFAGHRVERVEHAVVVEGIDDAAIEQRRRNVRAVAINAPDDRCRWMSCQPAKKYLRTLQGESHR